MHRICHYEPEADYGPTDAVYFSYTAPFKWMTIDSSTFDIASRIAFTNSGTNIALTNNRINVTNLMQSSVFQSSTDCLLSLPENSGLANNLVYINNSFTGVSEHGYRQLIHIQNHCNMTMVNNSFVDMVWKSVSTNAILFEEFVKGCPVQHYTKVVFADNIIKSTMLQTKTPLLYFGISLSTEGTSEI